MWRNTRSPGCRAPQGNGRRRRCKGSLEQTREACRVLRTRKTTISQAKRAVWKKPRDLLANNLQHNIRLIHSDIICNLFSSGFFPAAEGGCNQEYQFARLIPVPRF